MAQIYEVDVRIPGIGVDCRVSAPAGKVPDVLRSPRPEGHRPNFHRVPGGVNCVSEEVYSREVGTNPLMRGEGVDLVDGIRHSIGARFDDLDEF